MGINKLLTIIMSLMMTTSAFAWDSDREKDEDRRDSLFDNTRECECGDYDWSNRDPEGKDNQSSNDDDRRGLHLGHDDSKD